MAEQPSGPRPAQPSGHRPGQPSAAARPSPAAQPTRPTLAVRPPIDGSLIATRSPVSGLNGSRPHAAVPAHDHRGTPARPVPGPPSVVPRGASAAAASRPSAFTEAAPRPTGHTARPTTPGVAGPGGRPAGPGTPAPTGGTALERLQARLEAQRAAGVMPASSARPAPSATRPTHSSTRPAPAPVRPPSAATSPSTARPPLAGSTARPPLAGSTARPPLAGTRPPLSTPRPAGGHARPERPARPLPGKPIVAPTLLEIEATVDHEAYEQFASSIRALLGFDLTQYKRPQVWRRANSFAKQKGFANVHDLVDACKGNDELRTALRDMITINVSEFFRNPEAWDALHSLVLPELLKLGRQVRMWSAGCSLGYEPYSFAMLIREAGGGADARILATDLDETILAQARASSYSELQMVGLSPARRARFFDHPGDSWVVKPELRNMIQWKRQDLLKDPFPTDYDLIACRNVVIYFTDEAKDVLYRRFAGALRIGGVLFIGATEAISNPRQFGLAMITAGLYRRTE